MLPLRPASLPWLVVMTVLVVVVVGAWVPQSLFVTFLTSMLASP